MYILTWGYRHSIYNQYMNRRVIYRQVQNSKHEKYSTTESTDITVNDEFGKCARSN